MWQGHEGKFSIYVHASRERPIHVSPLFIGRDIRSAKVCKSISSSRLNKCFCLSAPLHYGLLRSHWDKNTEMLGALYAFLLDKSMAMDYHICSYTEQKGQHSGLCTVFVAIIVALFFTGSSGGYLKSWITCYKTTTKQSGQTDKSSPCVLIVFQHEITNLICNLKCNSGWAVFQWIFC